MGLVQFGRCGVFILGGGDGIVVAAPTSTSISVGQRERKGPGAGC